MLSVGLKKQAKAIRKLTGQSHMKILHELAVNHGFKSWNLLLEKEKK